MDAQTPPQSIRIDLWLWHARFFKTRALAAEMLSKKKIHLTHLGRQVRLDKPSRTVHVGDEVMFSLGGRITQVKVLAIGERRGPATEARTLYEDRSPQGPAQARLQVGRGPQRTRAPLRAPAPP